MIFIVMQDVDSHFMQPNYFLVNTIPKYIKFRFIFSSHAAVVLS
jgi:hypothetical protein